MKKLNRKFIRISYRALLISCVASLLCSHFCPGTVLTRAAGGFQVLCILIWFIAHRCPHCKKWYPILDDRAPDAGTCRKCGKVMEFDS